MGVKEGRESCRSGGFVGVMSPSDGDLRQM